MNGGLVLSTYNSTGLQWRLKCKLWDTTTLNSKYIRINYYHNVIKSSSEASVSGEYRMGLLEQVDKELRNGDDRAALSLVKDLQSKPGGLKCFGAAQQVYLHVNLLAFWY